jgi:hypothetical protein
MQKLPVRRPRQKGNLRQHQGAKPPDSHRGGPTTENNSAGGKGMTFHWLLLFFDSLKKLNDRGNPDVAQRNPPPVRLNKCETGRLKPAVKTHGFPEKDLAMDLGSNYQKSDLLCQGQ